MSNRRVLLALLAVIFLFAGTALVLHYSQMSTRYRISFRAANLPIGNTNGRVSTVMPDAGAAGVKIGDRVESVNGVPIVEDLDWANTIASLQPEQKGVMSLILVERIADVCFILADHLTCVLEQARAGGAEVLGAIGKPLTAAKLAPLLARHRRVVAGIAAVPPDPG